MFGWLFLLHQEQRNSGQNQNSANFNVLAALSAYFQINVRLLLRCTEDEGHQMISLHFITFIFQYTEVTQFHSESTSMTPPYTAPLLLLSLFHSCAFSAFPPRLLISQSVFLKLRGLIATSEFGMRFTPPDSLRMRSHVDRIILKIPSVRLGIGDVFFLFFLSNRK